MAKQAVKSTEIATFKMLKLLVKCALNAFSICLRLLLQSSLPLSLSNSLKIWQTIHWFSVRCESTDSVHYTGNVCIFEMWYSVRAFKSVFNVSFRVAMWTRARVNQFSERKYANGPFNCSVIHKFRYQFSICRPTLATTTHFLTEVLCFIKS